MTIILGIISALVGVAGLVWKIFFSGPKATIAEQDAKAVGSETVVAVQAVQDVKTETAIATAEANAPTTQAAVVDELDNGTF